MCKNKTCNSLFFMILGCCCPRFGYDSNLDFFSVCLFIGRCILGGSILDLIWLLCLFIFLSKFPFQWKLLFHSILLSFFEWDSFVWKMFFFPHTPSFFVCSMTLVVVVVIFFFFLMVSCCCCHRCLCNQNQWKKKSFNFIYQKKKKNRYEKVIHGRRRRRVMKVFILILFFHLKCSTQLKLNEDFKLLKIKL